MYHVALPQDQLVLAFGPGAADVVEVVVRTGQLEDNHTGEMVQEDVEGIAGQGEDTSLVEHHKVAYLETHQDPVDLHDPSLVVGGDRMVGIGVEGKEAHEDLANQKEAGLVVK